MSRAFAILLGIASIAFVVVCIFGVVQTVTNGIPQDPQRAICLQSHPQVMMIPTMCGKAELCDVPIVTSVCDRVQAPPPHPVCQGNQDE